MLPLLDTLVGWLEFKIAVPPVKESSKSDGIRFPEPEFSVKTGSLKVTATVLFVWEYVLEIITGYKSKLRVISSVLPMVEKLHPVTVPLYGISTDPKTLSPFFKFFPLKVVDVPLWVFRPLTKKWKVAELLFE